jgi:hypothetical protein
MHIFSFPTFGQSSVNAYVFFSYFDAGSNTDDLLRTSPRLMLAALG